MSAGSFFHGVRTNEIPTSIIPLRRTSSSLPIAFGCAPIHRLSAGDQELVKPGKVVMIHSLTEAGTRLGIDVQRDDFEHWTLSEVAYSQFMLYNMAPVVFVNLFDPEIHKKTATTETVTLTSGRGRLLHADVIGDVIVSPAGGGDAFVPGVDYLLEPITGTIQALPDGSLASVASVSVSAYNYAAPELVTTDECIGGYDVGTGKITGIQLIDQVFPWFREVPRVALAPKYSETPAVAVILAAKMKNINSIFPGGVVCADVPSEGAGAVTLATDVAGWKHANNVVDKDCYLAWGKVSLGGRKMRLSTHIAGVLAATDADHNDIPFVSPSNKNLQIDSFLINGKETRLDLSVANDALNKNGIVTALNWMNGWVLWGNRTACYPDVTDVKDVLITHRRMMTWYQVHLILTWWQKVDFPMTRRLVETIVNSEQIFLNSLVAGEALHGGRITLLQEENPLTDLIDGIIKFHVYLGLVPPAEHIVFNVEYDPNYILALFDAIAAA